MELLAKSCNMLAISAESFHNSFLTVFSARHLVYNHQKRYKSTGDSPYVILNVVKVIKKKFSPTKLLPADRKSYL